jgi:hypothetical protein
VLIDALGWLFKVTVAKQKSKELGFICLFTDGAGQYWFKCSRGFHTALNETNASLETLIDEASERPTNGQRRGSGTSTGNSIASSADLLEEGWYRVSASAFDFLRLDARRQAMRKVILKPMYGSSSQRAR